MSLVVACLDMGNYCGRGHRYVHNLRAQVAEHLKAEHIFAVYSDSQEPYGDGIEVRDPPAAGLKGWWNKIGLFRPNAWLDDERVIYFDLDTFVVDSIDFMADYQGRFAMLAPYGLPGINPLFDGPQSGVMAWEAGFGAHIWDKFKAEGYPDVPGGDQKFINDMALNPDLWQAKFPGKFASYKLDCQHGVPDGVAVCGFHGLPRPHQAGGWVRRLWNETAAALTQ